MDKQNKKIMIMALLFIVCFALRYAEYMFLRLDNSYVGENFVHKLLGIALLFASLKFLHYSWKDIGFHWGKILRYSLLGFAIGIISFSLVFLLEFSLLTAKGLSPSFEVYVEGFSLTSTLEKNTDLIFFALCLLFNIINVVMEEGLFRGLFLNIWGEKYGFAISNFIVALLFGIWHFTMPLRSYLVGDIGFASMALMALAYVVLAGMMSIKWGLLRKLSGVIWIGMAEHFFNNTLTNILHVKTETGTDEMQIVRIIAAQLMTLVAAVAIYIKRRGKAAEESA